MAAALEEDGQGGRLGIEETARPGLRGEVGMVVPEGEQAYWLRTEFAGCASRVFGALGSAAPPSVRQADARPRAPAAGEA